MLSAKIANKGIEELFYWRKRLRQIPFSSSFFHTCLVGYHFDIFIFFSGKQESVKKYES